MSFLWLVLGITSAFAGHEYQCEYVRDAKPYIEHHEKFRCPKIDGTREKFKIEDEQLISSVKVMVLFEEAHVGVFVNEIIEINPPRPASDFYYSVFAVPEVQAVMQLRNPKHLPPLGLTIESVEPVLPIL